MFTQGVPGIVKYIENMTTLKVDGNIERNYACTNKSGSVFHRLLESKEWKQDGGAKYINEVLDSLAEPATKHWNRLLEEGKPVKGSEENEYYAKAIHKLGKLDYAIHDKDSPERNVIYKKIKTAIGDRIAV